MGFFQVFVLQILTYMRYFKMPVSKIDHSVELFQAVGYFLLVIYSLVCFLIFRLKVS